MYFKIPDTPDTDSIYSGDSCLPTWDALQRYVRYEPIRVVRVGWSS